MLHQISIIVPTFNRKKKLNQCLLSILKQDFPKNKYEIIVVDDGSTDGTEKLMTDISKEFSTIKYYRQKNKGPATARNLGIKKSKGEIITFIDDDELPMNRNWLKNLLDPIINHEEKVVTSGYHIPLGNGYLTDSISFLGFPGGGYVGFKTMWDVDENNYTKHVCSGNFAFKKSVLKEFGYFNESFSTSGGEDIYFGEKVVESGIKIKYVENATVFHEPRKGFLNFMKWQINRGRSAYEFKAINKTVSKFVSNRLCSSMRILKISLKTKYFPMVLFLMFCQYLFQGIGFAIRKYNL